MRHTLFLSIVFLLYEQLLNVPANQGACTRPPKRRAAGDAKSLDDYEAPMKIAGEVGADEWPSLRTRLEVCEARAWQEAVNILRIRFRTRYLDHSRQLLGRQYSGFAVLAVDCAVVEALEQFRRGEPETPRGKGQQFFRAFLTETRFKDHFSETTADLFYKTIRCGILHQAETKEDSLVKKKKADFVVELAPSRKGLIINARRFHEELERALEDYATALLEGSADLRASFIRKMNYVARVQPGVEGIV